MNVSLAPYRNRAAAFVGRCMAHLISLGDGPATASDEQFDNFIRVWRGLAARPLGASPLVGLFPDLVPIKAPEPSPVGLSSSQVYGQIMDHVLLFEGSKFTNDPDDRGGPTRYGITQRRYDQDRDDRQLPRRSVYYITRPEVDQIYAVYYWRPIWGQRLPPEVSACVMDFGVNSGPNRAIKYLQWILDLAQTGRMDETTIAAALKRNPDTLAQTYNDRRRAFLRGIVIGRPSQKKFLRGWIRRVDALDQLVRTFS